MSREDPFAEPGDTDRTVIRPTPGKRPAGQPAAASAAPAREAAPRAAAVGGEAGSGPTTGLNPLVGAAGPLFDLVGRIRNRAQHGDPESLHQAVLREVRAFEDRALRTEQPAQTVRLARYAICATIDDVVLNTPWGERSLWSRQSMVGTFHKETVGGERFFDLLEKLQQEPGKHIDLLEFLYVCLSLGFEGRLRVASRGAEKHQEIRESLARVIRNHRGPLENDLSPHWAGLNLPHKPRAVWAPVWLIAGVSVAALALIFTVFSSMLSSGTDRLEGRLAGLAVGGPVSFERAAPPPPPSPPPPRDETVPTPVEEIEAFLAPEIEEELITVLEDANTITVRIRGKRMFASGSDQLEDRFLPVIDRVAEALNDKGGNVIVAGHSDNIPIRTARFPNNQALSVARAKSVMRRMEPMLDTPSRVSAEGRAAREPIASNDTAAGRARNRRIEVILVKGG